MFSILLLYCFFLGTVPTLAETGGERRVSPEKSEIWGPGLKAAVVLPARYFYIQAVDTSGNKFTTSPGEKVFQIKISAPDEQFTRVGVQVLDRKDGSFIVRYRMYASYKNLKVEVKFQGQHVAKSPYILKGPVYHENCDCPLEDAAAWLREMSCPETIPQIQRDLAQFPSVDPEKIATEIPKRFGQRQSLCHYTLKDNKVYIKTHGEHVGFRIFMDAILLSLTRKVKMPDVEFFVNLGDWPLEKKKSGSHIHPIFSWCGSTDSKDIVMPTYDLMHTSAKKHQDPDSLIAGVIRVVEKDNDVLLHWAPVEEAGDSTQIFFSKKDPSGGDSCPSEEEPTFDPGYEPDWAVISTVRPRPRHSEPTRGAEPSSPRGSWAFSVSLGELKSIRRSKPGLSWAYLVLVTQAGGSLPALHFHRGGTRALLRVLSRYLLLASSPQDSRLYLVFPHDSSALSNSFHHLQLFDQDSSNVVSRFLQDPYSTTFSSFSRVTNFFRGALQPHPEGASPDLPPAPDDEPEPGFEVISCVELGPRPAVERAPPVTEEEWARHVGPEGRLQQVPELKARIFSGGLSPSLRREAWKFLLGYLSWEGSAEEHKAHVRKKTDEYFRMKLQWKSVSPEQERRNSLLHGYRSLIERDVSRTDRTNKFYEGPENPGLGLLNDILLTYCMYHFDLGYVQGMSDLLSPILYVTQNEVDAFWCFCGFMELVHGNFEESQETMKRQLGQLLLLLRVLDPPLCDFLDAQDSGSLCFCFRWLLIWFKREFPFPDVLRLWEVLWTGLPGPNLHLLVACAILDMERDTLMLSGFGSNEILKHINELTMKLSVEDVLTRAEALYRQLTACRELPHNVQEVLGLAPPAEPQSPSPPASPLPLSPARAPPAPPPPADTVQQPDSSLEILPEEEEEESADS